MKITEIKINKVNSDKTKTKAFANVTLDDCFVLTGISIIEGSKGLFVAMPQTKGKDKDGNEKYFDMFFPTSKEGRASITTQILEEYNKTL